MNPFDDLIPQRGRTPQTPASMFEDLNDCKTLGSGWFNTFLGRPRMSLRTPAGSLCKNSSAK
jgi:hypothetical protein